ncbi:hypothetical protein H311_00128 [Anncaliia algerae PRA109]|nr:hypothetical protein H311_00128 [Anncaliia algerae PRA109]
MPFVSVMSYNCLNCFISFKLMFFGCNINRYFSFVKYLGYYDSYELSQKTIIFLKDVVIIQTISLGLPFCQDVHRLQVSAFVKFIGYLKIFLKCSAASHAVFHVFNRLKANNGYILRIVKI